MAIKRTDPRKLHDMPLAGNRLDDDILDALEPLEDGNAEGHRRDDGEARLNGASRSGRRPPTYQPFADLRQRLRGH